MANTLLALTSDLSSTLLNNQSAGTTQYTIYLSILVLMAIAFIIMEKRDEH